MLLFANYSVFFAKKNKMIDFITFCDYTGTFAFAISGIRLASLRNNLIGLAPMWWVS